MKFEEAVEALQAYNTEVAKVKAAFLARMELLGARLSEYGVGIVTTIKYREDPELEIGTEGFARQLSIVFHTTSGYVGLYVVGQPVNDAEFFDAIGDRLIAPQILDRQAQLVQAQNSFEQFETALTEKGL